MAHKRERHDRSSVTDLIEHIVITPKYRGKILKGNVAQECDRIIRENCQENDIHIIKMAIEKEHLHILIQRPPSMSTSKAVEIIKTHSSRELRQLFPHLKEWCPKALWSRGYHATSVGNGREAVINYIAKQGQNHALKGSIGPLPNAVEQRLDTSDRRGHDGN